MSQLTDKIRAKYPQYQNIPDADLEQRVLAKYPQYQSLATPKEPGFLQKAGGLAMKVLNAPSNFAGGAIKGIREGGLGGFLMGSGLKGGIKGAYQGLTGQEDAPTVYSELPKALGLQEGSTASKVVGIGGELLTPQIPVVGMVGKGIKGIRGASKVAKPGLFSKASGVTQDFARTMLEKSYKLSASDIEEIAKSIGAKDPATKAQKVIDYLEKVGGSGATRETLSTMNKVISPVQSKYDALVKTGKQVPRSEYANALLEQAVELEKSSNDPSTRKLVQELFSEAEFQSKKGGFLTDTDITNTKTTAFAGASKKAINDPYSASFDEQIGRTGVNLLERISPGSEKTGKTLRGLRTAQDVIGKKANTGLGTQLFNAFKPGFAGAGIGAGLGYATGQDPLATGAIGMGANITMNNPRVLNAAGKLFSKKLPNVNISPVFGKATNRVIDTAIRSPGFTQGSSNKKGQKELVIPSPTYNPIIQPSATPYKVPQIRRSR